MSESEVPYKPVDEVEVDAKTISAEDAFGATQESAHAKYERAHQASVAAESRKNAKPDSSEIEKQYREVDLRLKQLELEERGMADLDAIDDPIRWARARDAQVRLGIPYNPSETLVDESGERVEPQSRDENGRFQADGHKQSHNEEQAVTPVIPTDHQHFSRMREAENYFGTDTIAKIATDFQQSGVDLLPGLTREVAEFDNSAQVVLALMREPNVVAHLNDVASRSPVMASHILQNIATWVRTGEVPSEAQAPGKSSKPRPPEPVSARASSAFDLENESMSPDEWARKRTAERRAKGFSY
jgi:hypothetical protein